MKRTPPHGGGKKLIQDDNKTGYHRPVSLDYDGASRRQVRPETPGRMNKSDLLVNRLTLAHKVNEMYAKGQAFDDEGSSLSDLKDQLANFESNLTIRNNSVSLVREQMQDDEDDDDSGSQTQSQFLPLGQRTPSLDDTNDVFSQSTTVKRQIKSSVMMVATFWHSKYHANRVNELLECSFTQDEMYESMCIVAEMCSLENVKKNRSTDKRSGAAGQAQALYQMLEDLDSNNATPEFVVGLSEMEEVQRALTNSSLAIGDSVQVGARIESLEKGIKELSMKIGAVCIAPGKAAHTIGTSKTTPDIIITDEMKNTFANIAAKPVVEKSRVNRQRSNSQKRQANEEDDEGFNFVKKKKPQGKSGKSTFKVLEPEDNKYEIYISNVAPQTKDDEMKSTIVGCYEDFNIDKDVTDNLREEDIDVKDMTPSAFINPWRRSWRVSVPYKMKAIFEDENFYPSQWKFRQFYQARTNKRWKASTDARSPTRPLMGGA